MKILAQPEPRRHVEGVSNAFAGRIRQDSAGLVSGEYTEEMVLDPIPSIRHTNLSGHMVDILTT